MLTFKTRILTGISLPAVLMLIVINLALSLPQSNYQFSTDGEVVYAQPMHGQPLTVLAFTTAAGHSYPASPQLLVEDPDVLPTYQAIDSLMATLDELTQLLQAGELYMATDSGVIRLQSRLRRLADLPAIFWMQTIASIIGLTICILVWLTGQMTIGKAGFVLTGLVYALIGNTTVLYGTRSLFIHEPFFQITTLLGQMGTSCFIAGMTLFLANHPRPLGSRGINTLIIAGMIIALLMTVSRWHNSLLITLYLPFGLQLSGAIAAAVWQWRHSRHSPQDSTAVRWIMLFLTATLVPSLLKQIAPDIHQSVLYSSVVFTYAGMLFAVIQHQFFEMERWSYRLWSWLLGGLAILITDLLLASFVSLSSGASLSLALAIVGWLYFPLRQKIWKRFFVRKEHGLEQWLSRSLPELLHTHAENQEENPQQQLLNALQAVFSPLHIERSVPTPGRSHSITNNGSALTLVLPDSAMTIRMEHPGDGRRLFDSQDIHIAQLVLDLDELIRRSLSARADGARAERDRIRQDLHDDLGAKLLRLLYRSTAEDRPLVREAIEDLRHLLQNRQPHHSQLTSLLKRWQQEAHTRCNDHQVTLRWQQQASNLPIAAAVADHTERALREALSNALRNHSTPDISVNIQQHNQALEITIRNIFNTTPGTAGLGIETMHQRMQHIGGYAEISIQPPHPTQQSQPIGECWQVMLRVPLD